MADWVERYFDELYFEEQLGKMGEALATSIKETMGQPGTARTVLPAVPLQAASGKMPVKTVEVDQAAFVSALMGEKDG